MAVKSQLGGNEVQDLALDTYVKIIRAATTLQSALRTQAPFPDGMTSSQFSVLEALLHRGPLYQREISDKILKSTGNITVVIDHLERDGLVDRERQPGDRRISRVNLTPRGRREITAYFPLHARAITENLAVLSESEQRTLGELCKKLGRGIQTKLTSNGGTT